MINGGRRVRDQDAATAFREYILYESGFLEREKVGFDQLWT